MPHLRFVTDDNVDRFVGRLEQASSDQDRALFRKLLVAEFDRYAEDEHRREKLLSRTSDLNAKIQRQAKLLDAMEEGSDDRSAAEALMNNLLLVRGVFASLSILRGPA